jgi:glycosyltransferase involved in cell wall biosynthesis
MILSRGKKDPAILILINVRWWNATAFYAINIARILHKRGHRVIVGCNPAYPAYEMARALGISVAPLNFHGANIFGLMKSFRTMLRLIRKEQIRIINSHRSEDHTFGLLAKFLTGTKLVITRGDQRPIKKNGLSGLRYRFSDAVILTCRSILRQNRPIFNCIRNRVTVIYGSVNEDHFIPRKNPEDTAAKYDIPPDHIVVGMVGRISRIKDQESFLRSAAAVALIRKDIVFIVAGKAVDLDKAQLKKPLEGLGIIDRFRFLPEVNDIVDIINLLDIGVIVSVDSETISRVLLEYMYLKTAVIGTNVNVIGEIVIPGVTGELIQPGDSASLGRWILKLATRASLRKTYATSGYEHYLRHFAEDRFYAGYMEVFQRLF